jgi:putative DNA primase/helicase
VQKLAGYSITGEIGEHILPFAYGPGANGKSVFFSVIRKVLGDYASEAAPDLLVARYGDRGVPADIANLRGYRFVTTSETEAGKKMATDVMKRITGDDELKARSLYKDYATFRNVTHLWMAANDRPQVDGLDEAIWRRIRLIPFEVVIPTAERNPNLIAELMRERDGILGWLVEGCRAYHDEGLDSAPAAVLLATQEYRQDSNPLLEWFEECCEQATDGEERASDLHASYKAWCAQSRYRGKPLANSSPRWARGLDSLGLPADKRYIDGKQTRIRRGAVLRTEACLAI